MHMFIPVQKVGASFLLLKGESHTFVMPLAILSNYTLITEMHVLDVDNACSNYKARIKIGEKVNRSAILLCLQNVKVLS